jgi:tetratricopeptide (TPR) repeat protein
MQLGQYRAPAIPFWCTFIIVCCILVLPSCSDGSEEAAENAVLAQQALSSNNLPAARAAIAAAIADRDDVVEYHVLRGRIELALGSAGAAFDAYSDALALDPTNGEALLAVARLGLSTGNLRESLEATERVLALAPNQLDALLVRGIHSIVKRNYAEAIEYADKILALSPGNEGGTILKARALYMSRRPDEALDALKEISGDAMGSQSAALTRLEIYRALRRPNEMATEFERLRVLRADDSALLIDEANFRFKRGERRQAHRLVAEALTNPEADAPSAGRAVALWREYGADDLPAVEFERIGRKANVAARAVFARFLIEQGRVRETSRAIAALPRNVAAGLAARNHLLSGDDEQAGRLAAQVLGRDKTDCDALIAAAGSAMKLQKPADALRFAQQASSECPTWSGGWTSAARAYERLGRAGGVNRVFAEALEANKQSSQLTAAYARWLVSVGRPREAIAMARRLTRYAPALTSGWRLYGDLCRKFDSACVAEAATGLANARSLFGIDLPPGTPPPNGLFGRLVER